MADTELTAEQITSITDLEDAELYKLRVGNRILSMFSPPGSRFHRIQDVVDAEAERRIKAHPDRWSSLREALRRE